MEIDSISGEILSAGEKGVQSGHCPNQNRESRSLVLSCGISGPTGKGQNALIRDSLKL